MIDDLGHADLLVVDADTGATNGNAHGSSSSNGESSSCCEYGIESTVIKVEEEGSLLVLRRGAITHKQLEEALDSNGLSDVR